jgi:hypothetical protein
MSGIIDWICCRKILAIPLVIAIASFGILVQSYTTEAGNEYTEESIEDYSGIIKTIEQSAPFVPPADLVDPLMPVSDENPHQDDIDSISDNVDQPDSPSIASGEVRHTYGLISAGPQNTTSFVWQNPENTKIIVTRVALYIKTPSIDKAEMDIGVASAADKHGDDIMACIDLTRADTIWEFTGKAYLDSMGGGFDYITGQILRGNAEEIGGIYYITYEGV